MTARVGVLRSAEGLRSAGRALEGLAGDAAVTVDQDAWETTNLVTVSAAPGRGRVAARGDPRIPLARGLPRAGRRTPVGSPRLVARRRCPPSTSSARPHRPT